ncbi:hypothetical protein VTN00DRAFT_4789 [Thermoascus crustaceus]|uniref:uncharacterized protein n=1 Tax=Thermoascus crustaceus TaxID=5088 RepID=UPI003742F277
MAREEPGRLLNVSALQSRTARSMWTHDRAFWRGALSFAGAGFAGALSWSLSRALVRVGTDRSWLHRSGRFDAAETQWQRSAAGSLWSAAGARSEISLIRPLEALRALPRPLEDDGMPCSLRRRGHIGT